LNDSVVFVRSGFELMSARRYAEIVLSMDMRSAAGAGTEVELTIPGAVVYHESGRPSLRR